MARVLRIAVAEECEGGELSRASLRWDATIDGTPVVADEANVISPRDLWSTLERDGHAWIVTCECGDPGCGGVGAPILVRHEPATVVWDVPATRESGVSPQLWGVHRFDRDGYARTLDQALAEALRRLPDVRHEWLGRYPDGAASPRGAIRWLDEIAQQRKRAT